MMMLPTAPYLEQQSRWPRSGRHILASFDDESIIVYQAYRSTIARFAMENGCFGGEFSYSRMSWIKPNFLWMMYRSGWGTKESQESILGLRLRRSFFDSLLADSVPSTWDADLYETEKEWSRAVIRSTVRVQWDPDHNPNGGRLERRAIQLGLRGDALEAFGRRELLEVIDMAAFVRDQRTALEGCGVRNLITPLENVYYPSDSAIARKLKLGAEN
jgi:hypothetical protein